MGMNVGSASGENTEMVDMNTTPLIDVMLVLLIMFIISLPIQSHAVKLDMPRPNTNQPTEPPQVIQLDIDFDGTILWNGTVVSSTDQLSRFLASVAAKPNQDEIHLRPNRLARYDVVAKVMAIAQRLGVKKIGFVGNEQFL